MSLTLRPYQADLVDKIAGSYMSGNRAPLAVLPTGGGKTVIFCHIAHRTASKGNRALILVHRVELLKQTSKALEKSGVRHGLIHPQFTPDPHAPVQVASVQTLVRRLDKMRLDFSLIIIDEAHHANASTWANIVRAMPDAKLLGVTATPVRSDGSGLGVHSGGFFDDLIEGPTVRELIGMNFLVPARIFGCKEKIDLSDVHTVAGDYKKDELMLAVDKPAITGSAVEHYGQLCPGTPAVAFCVSVAHAEHVAQEFRSAGFKAYSVDGNMDGDLRQRILNGLATGDVEVVCSCDIISEGTDIPAIGCAILLRPTMSEGLYIQQVGRALRPLPGKKHAIILDHVGNVATHLPPEFDREWRLDGERRKKKAKKDEEKKIPIKQCDKCYAIHEPAPVCPSCGYVYQVEARKLEVHDGRLEEYTEDDKAAIMRRKKQEEGMCKSLEDFQALAAARGYKPNWAIHRWEHRRKKIGLA